jgi:hypothetical protein
MNIKTFKHVMSWMRKDARHPSFARLSHSHMTPKHIVNYEIEGQDEDKTRTEETNAKDGCKECTDQAKQTRTSSQPQIMRAVSVTKTAHLLKKGITSAMMKLKAPHPRTHDLLL